MLTDHSGCVSGLLTATMIYAAIAPEAALRSTFGETLNGPLAHIVVRNWGALIALVGGMLIYGAFDPPGRPLILTVAGISKAIFIGLVRSSWSSPTQAGDDALHRRAPSPPPGRRRPRPATAGSPAAARKRSSLSP